MTKTARFNPDSRWVRYDPGTQLWIPNRKRIYLYWYKFLQLALQEVPSQVKLSAYEGWGDANEITSTKFDPWWNKRWMQLFGYKEGCVPKHSLSTSRPKTDAIRYAYLVHTNRHRGTNWEIAKWIQRSETAKRGISVPSFAYAADGVEYSAEDKMIIQSRIGRYKKQALGIINNVCEGVFP